MVSPGGRRMGSLGMRKQLRWKIHWEVGAEIHRHVEME